MSNIIIFDSGDQPVQVRLEGETVWLSLQQLAELFGRDKSVISRHLRNIYATEELAREATVAKNATVQMEGDREVLREIEFYNLDAIISVGYRVNSSRATRFRQWATSVLRQHLVDGYTLNQQRLQERGIEFEQALDLLSRTLANQQLVSTEGEAVLAVIADYARSWSLLQSRGLARSCSIPIWPAGRRTFCTSSSRTTRWPTATSAPGLFCFCGTCA